MNDLKKEVLEILLQVKGSGKYVSTHINDFMFPDLEINTIGELSFPVNEMLAKSLITIAHKAPFGLGHETVIDNQVRSAWEIDAKQLNFKSKQWEKFMSKVITKTKVDLGIEDSDVSAHLYKMLIYETGDFFLPHRDSEKEKGMFGTMVIALPSKYTGGDLIVKFEGDTESIDFSSASANNKLCVSAFYADCEHEIKPLTSGYRVCLVYNLVQEKSANTIQPPSIKTYVNRLTNALKNQIETDNSKPIIVLLGHQYTPENFSLNGLKLNDRYKADILLQAADEINCYANLCLVTSYKIGTPEYSNYYDYDDDQNDDEETEIDEVIDESLSIEYWLKNNIPSFSNIHFEESDLITSFALDENEPVIKENSGYMGNYGPDIEHWYHYGAVVIWSKETNAQLILTQSTTSKLDWIDYFSKNLHITTASEISAVEEILNVGFNQNNSDKESNYDAIVNWVINRKDENFFSKIPLETCKYYFIKISTANWIKLLNFTPETTANKILDDIMLDANQRVLEHFFALLNEMLKANTLTKLVTLQISKIPFYLETLMAKVKINTGPLNKLAIQNLFAIDYYSKQSEYWINWIAELLLKCTNRNYLNNVLLPVLLEATHQTELIFKTLNNCKEYYQKITSTKPLPPENWVRQVPTSPHYKRQWEILRLFLESPLEKTFEYRKPQQERLEMENAIRSVTIDLKMDTIKKGSPHTLLISKTQDEYKKKLTEWEQDLTLLDKVIQRLKNK